MRYFFLFLLITFLCTCGRAQFTMTASIGLVDEQCTTPITDPNADCIGVPAGEDMLSYLPGQDGDIIITYRLTNNSGGTITMGSVTDSDRGVIVPVSAFTIVPGQTVTTNRIFPAETLPRTVTPTVTANVQNAAGASATVTGQYTLEVVAPMVSIEFGVARQADVCDNTIAPNCNIPFGALNGQTITVGALDTFTTRLAWTNSGLSTYDLINVVDQDDFQIANTGFDQTPGQTLISARHWEAPALPGTYNYSQTLTITDQGGNMITETVTYIIIVEATMVDVEFGVARQADVCDNTIAPNCNITFGALNGQTITVGALDTFTTRLSWTNSGLSTYDLINVVDQDDFQIANTGFDQTPGQTLISARHWEAPALPGTYNLSQTLTITDQGGNMITETVTYIVIVEAPMVEVEFGVVRQADVCDNTIAPNCNIPFGALNGQTITVGARDTFTTRYAWTNTGLGDYDLINVVDQDDFQIANTGFDQTPGQTLISARHWEAPDLPGTYNLSQTLTITDQGGNMITETVTYIVIVEAPMVEVEFGVARQADVCDNEPTAPNCNVPFGALNGQIITVGALDTFTTRYAWTNTGLGEYDLINLVDQDDFQIANTGFDQIPGQTLISARHWEAPALPGTYNYSQLLTITDQGGNMVTAEVTYIVIVQAPKVSIEFGVAVQADVCDNQPVASVCSVPFGPVNGQKVTLGAGDTLTTRFAWTNTGLGDYDLINIVDQDGFQIANTGFDQTPGQTLISARHWEAPDSPGTYNWSQTLTITDQGGNVITETVTFMVIVDCSLGDLAPPTAICQDRTVTLIEGQTVNINAGQIDNGSFDGCGALAGGGIDISSFTCDDEGPNTVTLTVEDRMGNSASCTATVTVVVEEAISSGSAGDCVTTETPVAGGQAWWDIEDTNGKLIAQVIIGNNTNIKSVRAGIYTSANMTEMVSGNPLLSKRTFLQMLDEDEQVVQPNNEALYVRLYYTEAEVDALLAADPGMGIDDLAIIKADGEECGNGYTGQNATAMNTTLEGTGCAGEDYYFEFFTGSFSTFYLFSNDALLPVELTTFAARAIEKQRVQLDWMTTTETGNDRFEIEHSTDGQTFTALGAVAGAGESTEEQWYDFVHETPISGLNYYRLRQIDFDGTETLSEVRVVEMTGASQVSVYPNPTVNELRVRGFAGGAIRVVDAQGRSVLEQTLTEGQALNVRSLPAGIYLLQLPTETVRWVKR